MTVAWVVVDMQRGLERPELHVLARRIEAAVTETPGPVWALVQTNPPGGPLRTLRSWDGCSLESDWELLDPVARLNPTVVAKTGYGARANLPVDELAGYNRVFLAGADTDACVLATALGLFDAGVPVTVRADLCLSTADPFTGLHEAALRILTRQLGTDRVVH